MSFRDLKRRGGRTLLAAAVATGGVLFGTGGLQGVVANGDTRSISLFHTHTRESINITFKRNGRYDQDALKQLNHFLRDWRNDDVIKMDPRLFDLVWEVYRTTGHGQPIQVVSSYRSPKTNAMLRSRSKGVAKHSQHTLGKAMDFRIPGASADEVRAVGLQLQRGGVGYYPGGNSYFIHMDTGSVRHWPRMTRTQLARVFPDGRTIHMPTDGKPMPGYELALADLRRGGGSSVDETSGGGRSFFARLFNNADEEEDAAPAPARTRTAPAVQVAAAPQPAPASAAPVMAATPVPTPIAAPAEVPVLAAAAPAMPQPRPSAVAAAAQVQMASLGGPRMVWQTGAGATPSQAQAEAQAASVAAPAMPQPRPASHMTAKATPPVPVEEPSMITAFAAEPDTVPLPLRTPMQAAMVPRPHAPDVARTAAIAPREASTVRVATMPDVKPELITAPLEANLRSAITPDRITRAGENTHLAHPDQTAIASLFHKPGRTLGQTFGGNPTGGLRSDMFQGRAVALIQTVRLDTPQPTHALASRRGG